MHTTVKFEVRWMTFGTYTTRAHSKEFDRIEDARAFKDTQAEKHADRRYTIVKITTEEV